MASIPRSVSESVRRLNQHLYGGARTTDLKCGGEQFGIETDIVKVGETAKSLLDKIAPPKRIRQSSKPLLNKLEAEWLERLKAHDPVTGWKGGHNGYAFNIRSQAKRYRLGNGIWYKPDFTATVDLRETAWEVKGPRAFRGGFENLKVAASLYPEIKWVLVWKDPATGAWQRQEVLP